MLAHWVPQVRGPRRQVFVAGVKVWIFRHRWDSSTTAVIALAFALSCAGQVPSSSPPPQPPSAPAPRFVVVLDAAHGGDDTGARLDSGQLEKPPLSPSTSACAPCLPPAASRWSPRANPTSPSTSTDARSSPTTPMRPFASACTPAKAAPVFTSSRLPSRPRSPRASWHGKQPRRLGSRAASPSPDR